MTEGASEIDATVEEATHLDEQLGGDPADHDAEANDFESSHTRPESTGTGVEEALLAREASGPAVEEVAESGEVMPVQFVQLEPTEPPPAKPKHGRLNNVYVDITVELGRKDMTVRELTDLKEQEVIELNKLAGESFDILVNQRPFAEGEIVVITDLMAVRITRLYSYDTPEDESE